MLSLVWLMGATACGNNSGQPEGGQDTIGQIESNILIAYFSRVGNMDFDEDIDAVTSASVNMDGVSVSGNAQLLAEMAQDPVGEALKPYRKNVVIASKFGVHHNPQGLVTDSRPESIRKAVEGSLKRLQTHYIDLYYQHRIDPKVPAEEVAGVMTELMKEGKILHCGISETDEMYLRKIHAVCPVTCIQNRYSMMVRWHE